MTESFGWYLAFLIAIVNLNVVSERSTTSLIISLTLVASTLIGFLLSMRS